MIHNITLNSYNIRRKPTWNNLFITLWKVWFLPLILSPLRIWLYLPADPQFVCKHTSFSFLSISPLSIFSITVFTNFSYHWLGNFCSWVFFAFAIICSDIIFSPSVALSGSGSLAATCIPLITCWRSWAQQGVMHGKNSRVATAHKRKKESIRLTHSPPGNHKTCPIPIFSMVEPVHMLTFKKVKSCSCPVGYSFKDGL